MAYNLTGLQNSVWIYDLLIYANEITDNKFAGGFMIAFFFIMVIGISRGYHITDALIVSSWSCFVLSLFFVGIGALNFDLLIIFILLTAFTSFFKIMSRT